MPSRSIIPFYSLNAGVAFDLDAQAYISAAGLTDTQEKNDANQLVLDLKGYSLWGKYMGIYCMLGSSSSSVIINMKNPGTYNLVLTGSPTPSSGGIDWNGSTQWATTNIPNTNIDENNFYISVYQGENTDELAVSFGFDDNSISRHGGMFTKFSGSLYSDMPNETEGRLQISTAYDTRGMFSASLTPTRQHNVYRNGSNIGSRTNTAAASYVLGNILLNARTTLPDFSGTKIISWFAVANSGFTGTEVGNEYTAVQAFQTRRGRNY